jgi:hypothetical protein
MGFGDYELPPNKKQKFECKTDISNEHYMAPSGKWVPEIGETKDWVSL